MRDGLLGLDVYRVVYVCCAIVMYIILCERIHTIVFHLSLPHCLRSSISFPNQVSLRSNLPSFFLTFLKKESHFGHVFSGIPRILTHPIISNLSYFVTSIENQ